MLDRIPWDELALEDHELALEDHDVVCAGVMHVSIIKYKHRNHQNLHLFRYFQWSKTDPALVSGMSRRASRTRSSRHVVVVAVLFLPLVGALSLLDSLRVLLPGA